MPIVILITSCLMPPLGTADFNRDGNLDLVLFNVSTWQSALWYLNRAGALLSSAFGPTLPANF